MASEATQRHSRIATLQTGLFAAFAAIIAVFTLGAGAVQSSANSDTQAKAESAQVRADFWQVVAGEKATTGAFSADKLAFDLASALSAEEGPNGELPAEVTDLVASPGEYPNVEDDLGIEPFDDNNQPCSECGPLSSYMLNQLREIQAGGVDSVSAAELANVPKVEGLALTPFGLSGWLWLVLSYAIGSIGALAIAIKRDTKKFDYPQRLINWRNDGGSSADPYKKWSKWLSPLYFWTVAPIRQKLGKDFTGVLKEMKLLKTHTRFRTGLEMLNKLSPNEQRESWAREMREQFNDGLAQISQQVAEYDSSLDPIDQTSDSIRQALEENLSSALSELRIRSQARAELESPGKVFDEIERLAEVNAAELQKKYEPVRARRR